MVVGVLELDLLFPGLRSLKEKRRIVKSLKDRVAHRFNVSIAEVADNDMYQRGTLGVTVATNDARHADEVLRKVVDCVVSAGAGRCDVLNYEIEVLHV